MKNLICAVVVAVGGVFAGMADYLDTTAFEASVEITPHAGKVTTTITDFPLLVRLDETRQTGFLHADCGANGSGIRFALEDGTLLAHEIDTWNPTGETLIWVKVPSFSADTKIIMYWKPRQGATLPEVDPADVWTDYACVYHFNDADPSNAVDSTSHHYDGVYAGEATAVDGKVGRTFHKSTTTAFATGVTVNRLEGISNVAYFTISGWMKADQAACGYAALLTKGGWSANGWAVNMQNNDHQITFCGANQSTATYDVTSITGWRHFACVFNGNQATLYENGVGKGNKGLTAAKEGSAALSFYSTLVGSGDELRVRNGAMSADRAAADYATQTDPDYLDYSEIQIAPDVVLTAIPVQYLFGSGRAEPAFAVTNCVAGCLLTPGTDYDFVYSNNTEAGTGYVVVTGKGDYDGLELTKTFRVLNAYAGAFFHIDANDGSTITTVTENEKEYVSQIDDAEGGSVYATSVTGKCPTIGILDNGMRYLDFGKGYYQNNTADGLSGYLSWSAGSSSIREVFLVFSDAPDVASDHGFLLSHSSSYQFHRSGRKLFHDTYSSANLRNGVIEVDGESVAYDYLLPYGFHVIHLRTIGNVEANRFAYDRTYSRGGELIGEALIFNKTLSDDDAAAITQHLTEKWFKTADFDVAAIPDQVILGGGAKTPTVTVTRRESGEPLVSGVDYEVAYSNNTSSGTAMAYVSGKGQYEGQMAVVRFAISTIYFVTPDADGEGNGLDWEHAFTLDQAVGAAIAGDEIRVKAGTYPIASQVTISKPIKVKGGYAGTDTETLAAEAMSVFDAENRTAFYSMFNVTTATGAETENVFERVTFMRGYVRGLVKTGAAGIRFKDCRFYLNGSTYNPNGAFSGVGANLTGTAAVEAKFEDCVFDFNARTTHPGNRNTCMQGAGFYATGFKRVYVDNCLFATNCCIFGISGEYGQDRGDGGGAIWADAQPMTVRNCRFIANNTPGRSTRGGTVRITGASGGTAFTNCLFVANCCKYSSGSTSLGAPIAISSNATGDSYDIESCTFAYNIVASTTSAAGLTVDKGTVKVRNSIFYGNTAIGITAHYGREIAVYSNGRLDIDYSLLTDSTDSYLSSFVPANLTVGEHMVYGDPLFGTTKAAADALKSGDYYHAGKYDQLMAIDVRENALGSGYSKAIDAGDPDSAYANEPAPNGGRINLGAYGNTAAAAVSEAGAISIADDTVNLDFAEDTKASVSFTLAGLTNYNAQVDIVVSEQDLEHEAPVTTEEYHIGGRQSGDTITFAPTSLHTVGITLYAKVTISAAGQEPIVKYVSKTVTGELPYFFGHGGGAHVMHVREGADGAQNGADWADAFADLKSALASMTAEKTEIWVAGSITMQMSPVTWTLATNVCMRGGFHGDEDQLSDREEGTYARLEGCHAYNMMAVSVPAGKNLYMERIIFNKSLSRAFEKTGNGDLFVNDCRFTNNSPGNDTEGRACYVSGSTSSTIVSFTNCVWRGNVKTGGGSSHVIGAAIRAANLKRLMIDDSLFVTNGALWTGGIAGSTPGRDQPQGACLMISDAPTTIRNSQFYANRGGIRGEGKGGIIKFTGGSGGTALTNVVIAGSFNGYAESGRNSNFTKSAGALVIDLSSAQSKVSLESVTLAYNLGDGMNAGGGLCVLKGTVDIHNSIVYGNFCAVTCDVAGDIVCWENGYVNLDYVRLTKADGAGHPVSTSVYDPNEHITYTNVTFGDPCFVTPIDEVETHLLYSGDFAYFQNNAAGAKFFSELDCHLMSPAGYYRNSGELVVGEKATSDCIDAGDPDDPRWVNEPMPNAHLINLGAYGGTAYASRSALAQPAISNDTVSIVFPNGFTSPYIGFTMAGDGEYSATVKIETTPGTDVSGGYEESKTINLVVNGQEIFDGTPRFYEPGSTISWRVTITAKDAETIVKTGTITAEGVIPPWAGKGGGANVVHVWPDVVGGDDTGVGGWINACRDLAKAIGSLSEGQNEIWLYAGTNSLPQTITLKNHPLVIRGGFTSAFESSPEERPAGSCTVFDGGRTNETLLTINNDAGSPVTLEDLVFRRGYLRGVKKTGAGDITVTGCRFNDNTATFHSNYTYSGAGMYLTGGGTAVFTNCVFDGNIRREYGGDRRCMANGSGFAAESMARVIVDDCLFVTNGVVWGSYSQFGETGQDGGGAGGAIYVNSAPLTCRNTKFLANRTTGRSYGDNVGGTVYLAGSSGDSAFTNCLFAGNQTTKTNNSRSDIGGAISVNLANTSDKVMIKSCTIAYNFGDLGASGAALAIGKGTVRVRDSILWQNPVTSAHTAGYGKEVTVGGDGYLNIDYSILTGEGATYITSSNLEHLEVGEYMTYADPLFGSTYATMTNMIEAGGTKYREDAMLTAANLDLHENGLGEGYSAAIDAGDPESAYANEPAPNGSRINLGFYGNTPEAATSSIGQPAIDRGQVSIEFADDTRPTISVPIGGEGIFNATVEIVISTNNFASYVTQHNYAGVQNGETVEFSYKGFIIPEGDLYVRVSVFANGAETVVEEFSKTITGTLPDTYGCGGGARVIHIRPGADGLGDGSDWANAYPDLYSAIQENSSAFDEIWIAGTLTATRSPLTLTVLTNLVIRGGFTGHENSPSERPVGEYSCFDGNKSYNMLVVSVPTGKNLEVERFIFTKAPNRAFEKTGAGNLFVRDCRFIGNGTGGDYEGRGCYVSGSTASTIVSFSNCVWRGNVKTGGGSSHATGAAIRAANLKRLMIDDSLFVTNGALWTGWIAGSTPGRDSTSGACLRISDAPTTIRNCRFTANRGAIRGEGNGGIIHITGASGGTALTNVVIAGSFNGYAESDRKSNGYTKSAGALVFNLSEIASKVSMENVTLAYNLGDGWNAGGGLCVLKGTVDIHNSIIFGNYCSTACDVAGDIVCWENGRINLDYVRLTEDDGEGHPVSTSVYDPNTHITYSHVTYGDPGFVTPKSEVDTKLLYSGDYAYFNNSVAGMNFFAGINCHLRSSAGYYDPETGRLTRMRGLKGVVASAIDAGDPASDCSKEPDVNTIGTHGKRINLGAYGNTPWATMTPLKGNVLRVR